MAITINGTTGIAGVDGSASTPALQGSDTNTGIAFPAADTVAFATGGSERMRIDSSGNVGIGTTSISNKLEVNGSVNLANGSNYGWGNQQTAIQGNTATNVMQFYTAAVERMRIDSSGNVGIGTSGLNYRLAVQGTEDSQGAAYIKTSGSNAWGLEIGTHSAASESDLVFNTSAVVGSQSSLSFVAESTGFFRWMTGGTSHKTGTAGATERMRIDSSGNVGIGISSPTRKLQVYGGATGTRTMGTIGNASEALEVGVNASNLATINSVAGSSIIFTQNDTERMRIDSSGNVMVGTTSTIQSGLFNVLSAATAVGLRCNGAAGAGLVLDLSRTAATGDMVYLRTSSSSLAGYISCPTSNTTTYNSVSDYRLKENIAPMTGALEKISALKPCTYTWKSDGSNGQGFIAHELQAVVPDCVTGTKDAVNEDGSIKPQGVDTSFLVATLTAAIQELKADLDATKADLDATKAELAALKGAA